MRRLVLVVFGRIAPCSVLLGLLRLPLAIFVVGDQALCVVDHHSQHLLQDRRHLDVYLLQNDLPQQGHLLHLQALHPRHRPLPRLQRIDCVVRLALVFSYDPE